MSATRFVLLALMFCSVVLTRTSSEFGWTKYCPSAEVSLINNSAILKCLSAPSAKELYSYQWDTTTRIQKIPQCKKAEDLMITPFYPFNSLKGPACSSILYNQMTGENIEMFICQSSKDQQVKTVKASFPQLLLIRKCCPRNKIFDSRTKTCVNSLNESENLVEFLINRSADAERIVVISSGPPICKGPVVNYKIDENDVFLPNNTYPIVGPVIKNNVIVNGKPALSDIACLEMTPDFALDRILIARVCENLEFCDTNACIKKCCPENELYLAKAEDIFAKCDKFVTQDESTNFHKALAIVVNQTQSTFDTTKDYGILTKALCNETMYAVISTQKEPGQWLLTSEGHIVNKNNTVSNLYCMEVLYYKSEFYGFHWYTTGTIMETELFIWWPEALLMSCVLLLMTLLVYTCLPSLRNLHGKTFMCYLISHFLHLICLWTIPWFPPSPVQSSTKCNVLATIELFSITSMLLWLNVVCVDIWWTFRTIRDNTLTKRKHWKKFMLYCLYAWGCSFLLSFFNYVSHSTNILPEYLRHNVQKWICLYNYNWGSYGALIWYYIPTMILRISNFVFIILVSMSSYKVKAELKKLNAQPTNSKSKQFHSAKERFVMNTKLVILTGVFSLNGLISYLLLEYLDEEHWAVQMTNYFTVICRTVEALLIFILFVLKKRVYQEFRQTLKLIIPTKKINPDM